MYCFLEFKKTEKHDLIKFEAEWMVLSEALREVIFMIQLLRSKLPMIVHVDNVGAIFMASNVTTTSWIIHVYIRYKYVNEYVEDGIVKIVFVILVENDSNDLTNNISRELHGKHTENMIGEKPNY